MPLPQGLRCGPAGWSYPAWNGVVYPKQRRRGFHPLEFLAGYVDTVEINTSFYQALRPELARLWVAKVAANPNFAFTAKLHQRFTHDRTLERAEVAAFKEGLWPLLKAGKLGCLLMQFPWSFRYTPENREFFIALRRAFHDFPLAAEMRHSSWMSEEAVGAFIDYHVGFCNIDQPEYTRAMPPTAFLTSAVGYVRLHGRNPANALGSFNRAAARARQHDYLYTGKELDEWRQRIDRIHRYAHATFVIANNDPGGKSMVTSLELARMLGDDRRSAPRDLLARYPERLDGFAAEYHRQGCLFVAA